MATDTASQEQLHETDIAIIGCGPVGAMLANLLGLQGITTLVLERLCRRLPSWGMPEAAVRDIRGHQVQRWIIK